jgi:hypothetical protein
MSLAAPTAQTAANSETNMPFLEKAIVIVVVEKDAWSLIVIYTLRY